MHPRLTTAIASSDLAHHRPHATSLALLYPCPRNPVIPNPEISERDHTHYPRTALPVTTPSA